MKLKQVLLGTMLVASLSAASAAQKHYEAFTLDYNDDTVLGDPSFSFGGGGGPTGFGWSLSTSIQVSSPGDTNPVVRNFILPSFTITAKPGWALSGDLNSFLGNLSFTEFGEASTSASASAQVSIDGGTPIAAGGELDKTSVLDGPLLRSGYFSGRASTASGGFSVLTVSNASLTLQAQDGTAVVFGQPQNILEFSFTAAAVPEPETWALLMAGLGLVGYAARRRAAKPAA